ncbi:MAG: peptidylprolyl isomerase [Gemmatimonadales bacterium]
MNRWILGALSTSVLLAGCDRFAARSDVAAEVGVLQLPAERVGGIIAKMGQGPTTQVAEFVSNLWLDYALFGRAVAEGTIKTDSAAIAMIRWPTVANARIRILAESLAARRPGPTEAALDSAYNSTDARLLQHLIVIPKGAAAGDTTAARNAVLAAAARIKGGANFGQVASQVGEDGSKNDQGYLGYLPKGQLVKEFEDVGYTLAPGEVSGLVSTQFGFHLIRRPTLDESRDRIKKALGERQGGQGDSVYVSQLTEKAELKVAGGAGAAIKAALADPEGNRNSSRTLVNMKGGNVTVADWVKWTAMFPLNNRIQMRAQDDTVLAGFAKGLAQQVLLLRAADSAKIDVAAGMWQFMNLQYTQTIGQVKNALGLDVPELADSSTLTKEQKVKLAGEKVDDFFTRLTEGRAQMAIVLPELAGHLRSLGGGKVNQAGVARAVELAMAQYRRDSAAAAARPPANVVTPAPGGPPVADSTGQ